MVHHRVNIFIFVLYMIGMSGIMIWQGIGITPDRYVLVLILGSLFIGKTRKFLMDWMPFLFILISYDFLRSLATILNPRVNYIQMIDFDKLISNPIPTIFLQNILYKEGSVSALDYFCTFFYFLHFALPLTFAFILWIKNIHNFKRFGNGLLILSYSAFATFVIFPAAPPWLAYKDGYLPHVYKILEVTLKSFPDKLSLPSIYNTFNPNTVAAVPSLHAGYPFLVLLFALKFFGKKGLWMIPYVLGAWFSIVYMGEHYIFDVLTGMIYATGAFYLSNFLFYLWQHSRVRRLFSKISFLSPF